MADNYLEKRYEEVFGKDAGRKRAPQRPSLDTLLLHNRSYRGFDRDYVVHPRQLERSMRRTHIFTHVEWDMQCYLLRCGAAPGRFVWAAREALDRDYALPTAFRMFRETEDQSV